MGSYTLMQLAKTYSKTLYSYAIDKFLDDCLVHMPMLISIGKIEQQKYAFILIKMRMIMFFTIIKAWFTRALSRNKIHGYMYELIKMCKGC